MSEQRKGDWIQTYCGLEFYPADPRPEEIDISDIAHALSNICRFTGHSERFYSVAEHCVHVSRCVGQEDALWALLHDASEAYICDMARPVKHGTPIGPIYKEIESAIMAAVCRRFRLPIIQPDAVTRADNGMLWREYELLFRHRKPAWEKWREKVTGLEPNELPCWSPAAAKQQFLSRYVELITWDNGSTEGQLPNYPDIPDSQLRLVVAGRVDDAGGD